MSDDTHRVITPGDPNEDRLLAAALRALPTRLPPVSPLPRLQARWAQQHSHRGPRRQTLWWALAAGIASLGAALVLYRNPTLPPATGPIATTQPSKIESLMAQSAEWETALRRFEEQSIPIDAGSALAGAELEDLIGLTDLQLSAALSDAQAESLWQRRVSLMSRLAEVRTQSAWQRGNGGQDPRLLTTTYPIN